MAGDIATRYVRIRPDAAGFKQETNRQVEDALKGVKRTIATALGGAGVFEILKSTVEAATGKQSAAAQIQLAVKNAGAQWEVYGKTVADVLEGQEHTKGFDFEEQAQAFGRIEQQTKNSKTALNDLSLAMDVARARHLQLAQVAVALSRLEGGNAQSLSRLGIVTEKYTGSVDRLKAEHDQLIASGAKLSKQQELAYKTSIAAAQAADKQTTVERARAEVLRRYGGQADAFAKTAAGQFAILHTSIQQVQESIGTAFLPLLTEGAKDLGDWANGLANSASFQREAATTAHELGQGIQAVGTGIEAIAPALKLLQDLVGAVGVGPILATVAAYKLLPPVLALAGGQEEALNADTQALQASFASLEGQIAAFSAEVAALGTEEAALATETTALAAAQEEIAVGGAAAGVGLSAMLGPLALLAGGLFLLHERFQTADHSAANFKDTVGKLQEATRLAQTDVTGAVLSRDQASREKAAAQGARDLAVLRVQSETASTSAQRLVDDQNSLRDATLRLREATHAYAQSADAARQAEADRRKGIADSRAQINALAGQITDLGKQSRDVAGFLASHGGSFDPQGIQTKSLEIFLKSLDKLAADNPSMTHAIENLKGIAEAAGKVPSKVEIGVILNPQLDPQQLTDEITAQIQAANAAAHRALSSGSASLLRGGLAPLPKKNAADFARDNGIIPPPAVVADAAKKTATSWSQQFVQHIDVSGIGDAIASALSAARSNISTQSDSIASAVGDALDERLRRTTLPLTREITALQASLDAEQAGNAARDAADAVTKAQEKLSELQSVYGTGALTAGQSGEIEDARKALADAQQTVLDQQKQARIASLQGQIDAAGKAEQVRKDATKRNLADLADEFNTGKISQEKYLAGVRKVLADQKVDFQSAGKLLGSAFADGFRDALSNLSSQVLVLTRGQLKGSTLTKPTSVTKAGADATQAILDQIAQSGGRFTIDNAGSLPKGLNVAGLVSAAKRQREEDVYREKSGKAQQTGLQYAQETNRHLERIADLLKHGTHVVVSDGTSKHKTRATAKATQS